MFFFVATKFHNSFPRRNIWVCDTMYACVLCCLCLCVFMFCVGFFLFYFQLLWVHFCFSYRFFFCLLLLYLTSHIAFLFLFYALIGFFALLNNVLPVLCMFCVIIYAFFSGGVWIEWRYPFPSSLHTHTNTYTVFFCFPGNFCYLFSPHLLRIQVYFPYFPCFLRVCVPFLFIFPHTSYYTTSD